jgi:hypothetical protein
MRHLARSVVVATLFGVACLALMGMGGLGGGREEAPARDFRGVLTDVDGTRIEADRLTTGASTSLDGDLGRGRLRVPFENIDRITFKPSGTERDRLVAEVKLREGEPVTLGLRSSTTFYGRTPSGAYQIRARDLSSVEFAH